MFQKGVRESMNRVPDLWQTILTWLTGKPLKESEKSYFFPKTADIAITPLIGILAIQILASLAEWDTPAAWPIIFALWIVLVGILRKLQVTHLHHAIHNRIFYSTTLNNVYATLTGCGAYTCVKPQLPVATGPALPNGNCGASRT